MTQGIYEAFWHASWKVELRIDDELFVSACDGSTQARGKIVHRFKNRSSKVHGQKLESFIDWDDPHFNIKRVRDATAKALKPPVAVVISSEPVCPCSDSCVQCDIGYHDRCRDCPRTR